MSRGTGSEPGQDDCGHPLCFQLLCGGPLCSGKLVSTQVRPKRGIPLSSSPEVNAAPFEPLGRVAAVQRREASVGRALTLGRGGSFTGPAISMVFSGGGDSQERQVWREGLAKEAPGAQALGE